MISLTGPATLDAQELADLLKFRRDSLFRDLRAGRVLAPIVDRRKTKLWSRQEVQDWLNAGAPRQEIWVRVKSRK